MEMMKTSNSYTGSNKKTILIFILLGIISAVLLFANIGIGSILIPFKDLCRCLFTKSGDEMFLNIIWQIRFPRTLAAYILGGALALSGYLLQTFFHNPLAGPFVLGISSGAKLIVALTMVFFIGKSADISSIVLIISAFLGALLSMGFVLILSGKFSQTAMLIVSGVMVGYICSAVTDLIVTFADDKDIVNLHNWSKGSFSGITWENDLIIAIVVLISVFFVFMLSKPISAYRLSDAYAQSMGVNIRTFRIMLVLLSGLLSACVTAFAGPVSFVGIAVPQIIKRIFRTTEPFVMIPGCFLGGAVWCLFCDLLARTVFSPTELSISTVTALFGVPVVIYVMIKEKSR